VKRLPHENTSTSFSSAVFLSFVKRCSSSILESLPAAVKRLAGTEMHMILASAKLRLAGNQAAGSSEEIK
jgi:hypothetical protein